MWHDGAVVVALAMLRGCDALQHAGQEIIGVYKKEQREQEREEHLIDDDTRTEKCYLEGMPNRDAG